MVWGALEAVFIHQYESTTFKERDDVVEDLEC